MNRKFYRGAIKVFLSNFLLIISGIVTGFLLPKFLGITNYGYYRVFNLYTTYVVFFDLGIANGVYLEFGGLSKKSLPRKRLRFYFKILFFMQIVFLVINSIIALTIMHGEYKFIFSMIGIYLLANNVTNYYEKISIAIGEFDALSMRNIVKSVLSIVSVVLLWISIKLRISYEYYKIYVVLFVLVYIILALQYLYIYKDISFGISSTYSDEKKALNNIIKGGISLLLADMIANLILTLDRQCVSILYDIDTYSIYSFAYSILKIIVLAVSTISSILYPALKRMTVEEMKNSYNYSLSIIGIIAFFCQLSYYPLCLIVEWFLPSYSSSLEILRVVFPSITINLIISLLMVNHYKALKKQKLYLAITLLVLALSALMNAIAYFVVHEPIGFAVASVITMIIWYVVSGYFQQKIYQIATYSHFLYLIINIFNYYIISSLISDYYIGFAVNAIVFMAINALFYRNEMIRIINEIRERPRK